MVERRVRIGRERFHPRPVAAFVRLAQTFESDVRVLAPIRREGILAWMDGKRERDAVELDGKRYLPLSAIETLPVGIELTIRTCGADADDAVEALADFLRHRVSIRALSLLFNVREYAADVQARIEALPTDPVLQPEEREELAAWLEWLSRILDEARESLEA